jgi:hypothetical protein
MKTEENFEDIIMGYGGKYIGLHIEGTDIKRYIIPQNIIKCPKISKLSLEELNRKLDEYEIYMIAFLQDNKLAEFVRKQDSSYPSCRGMNLKNPEDINPEDLIRIVELFPNLVLEKSKDTLQPIYR